MHNLKTVKHHTIKAHLDRLQDTAENLAAWSAGEILAGRLASSRDVGSIASALIEIRSAIESQAAVIRGPETSEN